MRTNMKRLIAIGLLTVGWLFMTQSVSAHCDTMDGPVVQDARTALEKKDLTPALKWIKSQHETDLKKAFTRALAVRTLGAEARELSDYYFFETLVRLHRQGEGAPYTGLKPSGAKVDPTIEAADKALDRGDVNALIKDLTDEAADSIRKRFKLAVETKRHADHTVEAGRKYVTAYVEFVHHIEALHAISTSEIPVHGHSHTNTQGRDAGAHNFTGHP